MLPNALIIGSMKSGTTSLFRYLETHPDLIGSRVKETNFFLTEGDFSRGVDWYQSLFSEDGKLAFEASPNYTKRHLFPGVGERIKRTLPDVKLVFMVRDPIRRMFSHYIHNVAQGREAREPATALLEEGSNYLLTSKYAYQLAEYTQFFELEQIKIIEFEKFCRATEGSMSEISE